MALDPNAKKSIARVQVVNPDTLEPLLPTPHGSMPSTLTDGSGNVIDSRQSTDGGWHLGTAVVQSIEESLINSTYTNLDAGATFVGVSEEALGVNAIQTYHYADQDCTLYIEQGDGVNWDIVDPVKCLANDGCTRTFMSAAPFFRLRVTNNGDVATTEIRTSSAMTPIINPLPRSLTDDGRLRVETTITGRGNENRYAWISPTNAISVDQEVRLVGTNFDGTIKDPNFWTESVTGSGVVAQTGEIKLSTGITADSAASYDSVRRARFVVGSALLFTGAYKFNDALVAGNVRRCGAYDDDEGFFFELDGLVFSVGSRKATVDTLISSGDFNGSYGPNFKIDPTKYYKLTAEWTPLGAFYYIDGVLLHKSVGGHLTRRLTLPIRFENYNTGGGTTAVTFDCLGVAIMREGRLETSPIFKYILGAATTVLKYGAGNLHAIINNDNAGSIIVYDNTAGSGPIIASIDLIKVLGSSIFNVPFSNGLTIVSTGSVKITVTYE